MKMEIRTDEIVKNAAAALVIGMVAAFTVVRLFYGVELTDEAYTVAETYIVSKGALPFVNNWSQMPGYTLLLAPFVKVFTMITGGTDGIVLFFRFLAFFINVVTAFTVSFLLRKHIRNVMVLAMCSMIYITASGREGVVAFRGDNLSINLLAVGVLPLVISFLDETGRWKLMFASGILTALAVLCYPTLAIEYFYFVAAIGFLCHRNKMGYKSLRYFLGGSVLAAAVVAGYLAANSGISDIFFGIQYLLKDVAYFQLENGGLAKLPGYGKGMMIQVIKLFVFSGASFICAVSGAVLFFRKEVIVTDTHGSWIKRVYLRRLALLSLLSGVCLYHLYQIWIFWRDSSWNLSIYAMTVETLAVPLVWFFIEKEKSLCNYLLGFVWFPSYIWVVITGISTYSNIIARHTLLKNASYLLWVFVVFAVKDCFSDEGNGSLVRNGNRTAAAVVRGTFLSLVPIILVMCGMFTYLFNAYVYVYRDESISQLTAVVSRGPYKGIHTTDIRADGLMKLDKIIDTYVENKDYVLAMDNNPFFYLMSEGNACTPSTWDMALYSYGFDRPDLYYDYFKVAGTEPTKIIYFNYGRDGIMSIDVEYKFNEFVRKHYDLIYEDRNIFEWNYCGNDVVCELLIFDRK